MSECEMMRPPHNGTRHRTKFNEKACESTTRYHGRRERLKFNEGLRKRRRVDESIRRFVERVLGNDERE